MAKFLSVVVGEPAEGVVVVAVTVVVSVVMWLVLVEVIRVVMVLVVVVDSVGTGVLETSAETAFIVCSYDCTCSRGDCHSRSRCGSRKGCRGSSCSSWTMAFKCGGSGAK